MQSPVLLKFVFMSEIKSWVLFNGGNLLLKINDGKYSLPQWDRPPLEVDDEIFNVGDSECCCCAAELRSVDEDFIRDSNMCLIELRSSYPNISPKEYQMAGKGRELIFWHKQNKYCGRCGTPMHRHTEISKICNNCHNEIFPQLSPAVLVLVRKNEKALLVHAKTFSRPFFGLVAGFVETGESLEECVVREVKEETSLEIENVKYVGSQAWPFPANLMIGFTADYKNGEIYFVDKELDAGEFFDIEHLPEIPLYPSLARKMIDDWMNEISQNHLKI